MDEIKGMMDKIESGDERLGRQPHQFKLVLSYGVFAISTRRLLSRTAAREAPVSQTPRAATLYDCLRSINPWFVSDELGVIAFRVATGSTPNSRAVRAPELDDTEKATGNVVFVLIYIYESQAGVDDHMQQANDSWAEWQNFQQWLGGCDVRVSIWPISHSLW